MVARKVDHLLSYLNDVDGACRKSSQEEVCERTAAEADKKYVPGIVLEYNRAYHRLVILVDKVSGLVEPYAALKNIFEVEGPDQTVVGDDDLAELVPAVPDNGPIDFSSAHRAIISDF